MGAHRTKSGRLAIALVVVPVAIAVTYHILRIVIFRLLLALHGSGGVGGITYSLLVTLRWAILIGVAFWAILFACAYVRHGHFNIEKITFREKNSTGKR